LYSEFYDNIIIHILVVVVKRKGYIPMSEPFIPKQIMGVDVHVESGLITTIKGPAIRAIIDNSEDRNPLWIGMSIGVKSSHKTNPKAGTLGAFLECNGQYFGITARHVVTDNENEKPDEIDAPAKADFSEIPKSLRPNIQSLKVLYLPEYAKEVKQNVVNTEVVISVDAALLSCDMPYSDSCYWYYHSFLTLSDLINYI